MVCFEDPGLTLSFRLFVPQSPHRGLGATKLTRDLDLTVTLRFQRLN